MGKSQLETKSLKLASIQIKKEKKKIVFVKVMIKTRNSMKI